MSEEQNLKSKEFPVIIYTSSQSSYIGYHNINFKLLNVSPRLPEIHDRQKLLSWNVVTDLYFYFMLSISYSAFFSLYGHIR